MVERTHANREKEGKQQKGHKKLRKKTEWKEQNKLRNFGTSLLMYRVSPELFRFLQLLGNAISI